MERSENLATAQALERIAALVDARVQQFLTVKAGMAALYDTLGLGSTDRARMDRYIHCLELMVHGSVYSHAECVRYSTRPEHTRPIAGRGFIQDLHLDAGIELAHELTRKTQG
jgi:hypothetical protein